MPDYDLVIRGGTVIDGSGAPGRIADVAVKNGLIAAIGDVPERGAEELDATGYVVTPGFVDGHTHLDAQIFWDPLASPSSSHGVTTVVFGNCGFTLAPVNNPGRELVVRNLERAEDIPGEAIATGLSWSWSTFPEFLDAVEAQPKVLNVASYIGHSALRTYVMGERAFTDQATPDELERMKAALREALRAGAIGLSSSRSVHETSDDRPVASRVASWDEVRALVAVLGEEGTGVFEIANESVASSADLAVRDEYFDRIANLAIDTGVPVTFGLQPAFRGANLLAMADRAAASGGHVFGQSHARGIATVWSFNGDIPYDKLPEWQAIRALPRHAQRTALSDPDTRARLVHAAHTGAYPRAVASELSKPIYERLQILDKPLPPYRTVAEVAGERGVDPVEVIIDLVLASDFAQFFRDPLTPDTQDELLSVMRHPRAVMTFSDSGAHVGQIVDVSIHTHLLGYWVRERGDFTLEAAVRMITSVPAGAWGFTDRGALQPGLRADINVFDPAIVGPTMPSVVWDLPGGLRRLSQGAQGFVATVVGGQIVMRHGEHTGALPGTLARGPFTAGGPALTGAATA